MPVKVALEDGTEVEALLPDEVTARETAAAEKAAAEGAAKARQEILSDPKGGFAAARIDAERKLKAQKTETQRLETELAAAKTDADKSQTLEAELKVARDAEATAQAELATKTAEFQRQSSLVKSGVKPGSEAKVEALLKAEGVDLTNADAVKTGLDAIKVDAPGLFAAAAPYRPAGGGGGSKGGEQYNPEQLAGLPLEQYAEVRTAQSKRW